MSDKYPLFRRCFPGVGIDVHQSYVNSGSGSYISGSTRQWVLVEDIERALEKARNVWIVNPGEAYEKTVHWAEPTDAAMAATHNAILLGIEPIKKDTADSILADLISDIQAAGSSNIDYLKATSRCVARARKLLGEEK